MEICKQRANVIVPDFLFRRREATPSGSFRTVYGRIVESDLPVSPSQFVSQKAVHANVIIAAGGGMLDDVILNWFKRFNVHRFLARIATIEMSMMILMRSGMIPPGQQSVSEMADALHRIVRTLFFPVVDLCSLAEMTLEVASFIEQIAFREDDVSGFLMSSIGKSTKKGRASLTKKLGKARASGISRLDQKRRVFLWRGDARTALAMEIVEEAYSEWKGRGFLRAAARYVNAERKPTRPKGVHKTSKLHDRLNEGRTVMWQLHFRMAQKDPASTGILFEEMDEVMFRLALPEVSKGDKKAASRWGEERLKGQPGPAGRSWHDRMSDILVNKVLRTLRTVAKKSAQAALLLAGIDVDIDFLVDLSSFVADLGDLAHFAGFTDADFAGYIPSLGDRPGFSLLVGDVAKDTADLAVEEMEQEMIAAQDAEGGAGGEAQELEWEPEKEKEEEDEDEEAKRDEEKAEQWLKEDAKRRRRRAERGAKGGAREAASGGGEGRQQAPTDGDRKSTSRDRKSTSRDRKSTPRDRKSTTRAPPLPAAAPPPARSARAKKRRSGRGEQREPEAVKLPPIGPGKLPAVVAVCS